MVGKRRETNYVTVAVEPQLPRLLNTPKENFWKSIFFCAVLGCGEAVMAVPKEAAQI